jgi:hypothetical protein
VTYSPPKTEELLVSNKRKKVNHPQLSLDGQPIKQVPHHKHLGLTIASDLSWTEHITTIADKATRRLGILRPLKYKLDRLSLEKIYKCFIRPTMEYGDVIWHNPSQVLDLLERVQMNAARIVTGATARCSSEGLYSETAWEPLADRRDFHRLTLYYKILNGKAPFYLANLMPTQVRDRTHYLLRNRENLDQPFARINIHYYSFVPAATRAWNELKNITKNLLSVQAFKNAHSRLLPKPKPCFTLGADWRHQYMPG